MPYQHPTFLAAAGVISLVLAGSAPRTLARWDAPAVPARAQEATVEKRFPQLTVEQLNEQQRPLADAILKVSSVGIGGPYNALLRSPVLGDRMFSLLDYLRFNTSIDRRLNEFAILIQARLWTSQVEWYAHQPIAIKAGLAESVIADLKAGRRPAGMKADEAVVYDLSMELSTTHQLSDATWKRAREVFTDQQIVDLITTSGTYVTLAMLMNAAREPAPGATQPLAPLTSAR
jgi:4-carboxymuconolactone decarboxylase